MKRYAVLVVIGISLSLFSFQNPAFADDCDKASRLTEESRQYIDSTPQRAEELLREAVSLCAKSPSLHYNLGVALYQGSKEREAEAEFEEALRLKPDYAKAMNSLASVLYLKKDGAAYDRALGLAKKAAKLDPRNRHYRDTCEMIDAYVDVPPQTSANNPDAIAVVIGNRTYEGTGIPPVEYADRDAGMIRSYLVESMGFREGNILFYQDAKYTDLLTVFGDGYDHKGLLYNRIKTGRSDVFIFYSGHGAPDTNTKKAYLAPVDLNPNAVKHTSYPLDLLYDNLAKLSQEKQPKSLTIVLDACFSGASEKGMIIRNASPIMLEVTSPVLKLREAAVLTSSRGDQISSWYAEQKHGLFTYFFLKAIKEAAASNTTLTVGELEQRLIGADGVNDTALRLHSREQTPQVIGNKNIVLMR